MRKSKPNFPTLAVSFHLIVAFGSPLLTTRISAQEQPNNAIPGRPLFSESRGYQPREFQISKDLKKQKKQDDPSKTQLTPPALLSENRPVNMNVSVVNIQGKLVSGLTKENFELFIDGQQADITSVTEVSEPVNIIFLIDASPSADGHKKKVISRAQYVLSQLAADDRAMVVRFDSDAKVLCKLTNDFKEADKAIRRAFDSQGNGTALYNQIRYLSEEVIPPLTGRTAVLMFTDGVDTTSKRARYDTSLAIAERIDAVFYTEYFDTMTAAIASLRNAQSFGVTFPLGATPEEYAAGVNYINDLATLSGGRATRAETVVGKSTVLPIGNIPLEVRNRYVVTFTLPMAAHVGERKELKVRITRANLVVLARGSYIVR